MRVLYKDRLSIGIVIAGVLAAALFIATAWYGKKEFFLSMNTDAGTWADQFFKIITEAGNGGVWIPVLLLVIFVLKRPDAVVLIVAGFVFSTLFTQTVKHLVLPGELRPTKAIEDLSLIHTVPGVTLHGYDSFPSGHTGTAFTVYLVLVLLVRGNGWLVLGLFYAMAVGYSRIYLAQHFPMDVGAGICVGILSAWLSYLVQKAWWKRRRGAGNLA